MIFGGETALLTPSKGLLYIAALLREPGREFSALELRQASGEGILLEKKGGAVTPEVPATPGDLGESTSIRALAEVKARLDDLDQEIEEAQSINNLGQLDRLNEEKETLFDYIRTNTGRGGRARRSGDPRRRVLDQVGKAIRRDLKRVAVEHPKLHEHLLAAIGFGGTFSYRPELIRAWST